MPCGGSPTRATWARCSGPQMRSERAVQSPRVAPTHWPRRRYGPPQAPSSACRSWPGRRCPSGGSLSSRTAGRRWQRLDLEPPLTVLLGSERDGLPERLVTSVTKRRSPLPVRRSRSTSPRPARSRSTSSPAVMPEFPLCDRRTQLCHARPQPHVERVRAQPLLVLAPKSLPLLRVHRRPRRPVARLGSRLRPSGCRRASPSGCRRRAPPCTHGGERRRLGASRGFGHGSLAETAPAAPAAAATAAREAAAAAARAG